jgi:hypothetical protein
MFQCQGTTLRESQYKGVQAPVHQSRKHMPSIKIFKNPKIIKCIGVSKTYVQFVILLGAFLGECN